MNPEAPHQSKEENPNDGSDQVAVRQGKLDQMRENGFDPFRSNWEQTQTQWRLVHCCQKMKRKDPSFLRVE